MERSYKLKVILKQILRAQEHLRDYFFVREKPQMSEQELTFSIKYYPAFPNVRSTMVQWKNCIYYYLLIKNM